MPATFIGHGSPMNTLERNRYTEAWRALGATSPSPRAFLVVSAHWYINATAVTAMPQPRTIHDFYGFPEELSRFEYPAPGAPDLAEEIAEIVKPAWVGMDRDSWGLDHGTWSVLAHLRPAADIPVVQLAINAVMPLAYHFDLGARLAPLRERGVLVVGSGNIVHNLGRANPRLGETGEEWAIRFDRAATAAMTAAPRDVLGLAEHPDYDLAAPIPDHFIPLLYLAGLAEAAGRPAATLIEGYAYGSLSMTAYTLDGAAPLRPRSDAGAADFPESVPPEATNV